MWESSPRALATQWLGSPCLWQLLWLWVVQCHKQASGDLGPPCLQQLPWLLEAHAPVQVDPRASAALWASDDSKSPALLLHGYPQLATQYQEPATTHLSDPQVPGFAILLVQGGFPSHTAWRPSLPTVPDSKRALAPHQRARMPDSPLRGGKP
jgi:hypothetical protein